MIDRDSSTWASIERHIKAQIESLRDDLERPDIVEREADMTRGRIAALRQLLEVGLENASTTPETVTNSDGYI